MSDNEQKLFLSLKEYITLTLDPMNRELANMRTALEKLANSQINAHDLNSLRLQVASLSELIQELETRLETLEQHDNISTWLFRSVVGIGTALLIGYLSRLLF